MTEADKRKYPRFDSLNLSYICLDEDGAHIQKSMGRTLNVSESGICLETHFEVDSKHTLLLTIALEEDLVELKGKVAYCRPGEKGMYITGLEFVDLDGKSSKVLSKFITLFEQERGELDLESIPDEPA